MEQLLARGEISEPMERGACLDIEKDLIVGTDAWRWKSIAR